MLQGRLKKKNTETTPQGETEQDPMVFNPSLHHRMSSACLLSVELFGQRISLIREMRNEETKRTVKGDRIIIIYSLSIVKDL